MNNIKRVIVIGSGFGGIAAALRLKAKGYDVTLIEKQNTNYIYSLLGLEVYIFLCLPFSQKKAP